MFFCAAFFNTYALKAGVKLPDNFELSEGKNVRHLCLLEEK